jgi:tRNA uridine 5-carbamoylmethylation protein Kti12
MCRVGIALRFLLLVKLPCVGKVAFSRGLVVELEGSAVAGAANSTGLAAATFWAGAVTLGRLGQAK